MPARVKGGERELFMILKRKIFHEKSEIYAQKSAHEFLEIHNCHCLLLLFVFIELNYEA